jgi:integrase/recombinase XerD
MGNALANRAILDRLQGLCQHCRMNEIVTAPAFYSELPTLIANAPVSTRMAVEDFFLARLRNAHTRNAYARALRDFMRWLGNDLPLEQVAPAMIGRYIDGLNVSTPIKKLVLSALRQFFDLLVTRHLVAINPAASVRSERYQVLEGKTPEISQEQAKALLASIDLSHVIGLRDRAVIATLLMTAARAGAVSKLKLKDFIKEGGQYVLRFSEKGNKQREIPVRHDLEGYLTEYLDAAGIRGDALSTPLFRSAARRTKTLTSSPLTGNDILRLLKRRLRDAELPERISPHSMRVFTITNLLEQGVQLTDVQYLAGHSDSRTTRLYDRRQKRVTRNIVERISL